ncbi:7-cyano-7-deazaguanine synthase QueC [Allorhodopirellula solitaria]|uniref:7-cyano-7-deazaguanine synthase n=1 Tax=Allorhodopirellula solitaria TaxID=2527987 RepID=A0A5C5WPF3_9BACT|nr:7-cyano-7-deazaguanine synthase QueC [Allorhodopirellula solitaria]TWT52001.1 7-cyano-7-deazaguanine synthase [Allorhodopirellula solitaria]
MLKAIVLLSGGLDSTTMLAIAKSRGFAISALTFAYGQRHQSEVESARRIAEAFDVGDHTVINIDLRAFGGSALTDSIDVPKGRTLDEMNSAIPTTYVPARNTIFLSYALALAESREAFDIFIGANSLDYSGYPDCRPEYISAFQAMANLAMAQAVKSGRKLTIHAPLIDKSKAAIVQVGADLGVDYASTVSCYEADSNGRACGRCDACVLRRQGFEQCGLSDPTRYVDHEMVGT